MLTAVWFIFGLLLGIGINGLADFLPQYRLYPAELRPFFTYFHPPRRQRDWLVLGATAVLLAFLTITAPEQPKLLFLTFYIALLILIMVIDLEHKFIFNQLTYSGTAVALLGSTLQAGPAVSSAITGGIAGFLTFGLIYWAGTRLFGGQAFGLGDVKLAALLGAMIGLHEIFHTLMLGMVLGSLTSLLLLLTRRVARHDALPYGQYLATAGIIMLIWGKQIVS